ncbi:MAG: ABA4-like family protein [Planctomycetales bacterium]
MSPDTLFQICNWGVLPAWALLIAFPRWKGTGVVVACTTAIAALVYVTLLAVHWSDLQGGFLSLSGVALLFENRWALLAGWIHYLALDLLAGAWQSRESQRLEIPRWRVVPCLILTLLFAPAGLLAFLGVRWTTSRELSV